MLETREFSRLVKAGHISPETTRPLRFRIVAVVQGYIRLLLAADGEVNGGEMAAHLATTRETLAQYVNRGIIEKLPNGNYNRKECRERTFRHLREQAGGRTGQSGDNLASARAELAKEQRDAIAIKNSIARGDFVPLGGMVKKVMEAFSTCRERLLTIPGKIADACAMRERDEIEEIIRDEIEDALNELAEPGANQGGRSAD